jgi:soluble lytic murein transglycosylase-like protein
MLLLSIACSAALFAAAENARGRMTIRDVPLNRTAAWGKHVTMLREARSPKSVPPLRILGVAPPVASVSRGTAPSGGAPREWLDRIRRASIRHGVEEALLTAVLKAESNFDPNAVSPKGARGAMQIMPETGRKLGLRDFFDPDANLDAGAGYLASLLREFSSLELALAAYNAGPDAVRRHSGLPPYAETRTYVARVLALFKRYREQPRWSDSGKR